MTGWLHGVCVGECFFVFPLCGFSLSLFCNYSQPSISGEKRHITASQRSCSLCPPVMLHYDINTDTAKPA